MEKNLTTKIKKKIQNLIILMGKEATENFWLEVNSSYYLVQLINTVCAHIFQSLATAQ